ncbi:hypothetical protein [Stenotrophomonas sepilia]|jgi:hypothetical protein
MAKGSAKDHVLDEAQLEAWVFSVLELVSQLRNGNLERTLFANALDEQEDVGRWLKGNLGLMNFSARGFGGRLIFPHVIGPSSRAFARAVDAARRDLEFDVLTRTTHGKLNVLRRSNDLKPDAWLSAVPQLTAGRLKGGSPAGRGGQKRRQGPGGGEGQLRHADQCAGYPHKRSVYHDSEFLLLNYFDLALRRLYRFSHWRRMEGVLYLFTERRPCSDCCHVIIQLLRRYRRIQLVIVRATGGRGSDENMLERLSQHPRVHLRKVVVQPVGVELSSPLSVVETGPLALPYPDGTPRRGWSPKGAEMRR